MLYVRNHKLMGDREVGKWHKVENPKANLENGRKHTDCGRVRITFAMEKTTHEPRNLTPVISCGVCFDRSDWIKVKRGTPTGHSSRRLFSGRWGFWCGLWAGYGLFHCQ